MNAEDIEVHYGDHARSMHTLLRVVDPEDSERSYEVLFDNLWTPMVLAFHNDWHIVEETIIDREIKAAKIVEDGQDVTDREILPGVTEGQALVAWREYASGPGNETLLVVVHGDPELYESLT